MSELTPRQREIVKLIQESLRDNGMPPTRAEIANELGFKSPNAAEEHLRALARKGVIALVPGASRGIKLMDTMREQLGLPLIGRVAAGRPILAEENIESRLDIDPSIFQPPHAFGFYDQSTSTLVSAGQTTHLTLVITPRPQVPFAGPGEETGHGRSWSSRQERGSRSVRHRLTAAGWRNRTPSSRS